MSPSSTRTRTGCGSCGRIRASSSGGWGPPNYPATFTKHDLTPGGRVEYHMTGPEGDQVKGYLDIVEAQAPHRLVLQEGFASDVAAPSTDLPGNEVREAIEAIGEGRTRMSIETIFSSREAMEQFFAMGMEEGLTASIGQIDSVLAEDTHRNARVITPGEAP